MKRAASYYIVITTEYLESEYKRNGGTHTLTVSVILQSQSPIFLLSQSSMVIKAPWSQTAIVKVSFPGKSVLANMGQAIWQSDQQQT